MSSRLTLGRLALLSGTVVSLSCSGNDGGTGVQEIATVAVSPGSATLTSLGATQQLGASARDANGAPVSGTAFTWSSSASGVASVDATGLVTAVAEGSATITASAGGSSASGTATITVAQTAAAISVEVAEDTVTVGASTQATAAATDAGGSPLASPTFTWSSSDAGIATVDANGLVTGVSDGAATITATRDGVEAGVELVVIRPDVVVLADTVLGGNVAVGDLTVMTGTTVTLSSDLTIDATGDVTIEGAVMGDCVDVAIGGSGAVTVSGVLNNACVTQANGGVDAPGITIDASGGVNLDGAEIVTSGPLSVTSRPAALAPRRRGAAWVAAAPASAGDISLEGAVIRADPTEAPQLPEGDTRRPNGADFEFDPAGELIVNGTTIHAQDGAPGLPVNLTGDVETEATGGDGGRGGSVRFLGTGGGALRIRGTRGTTRLIAGNGAPGGPATATTTQNPAGAAAPAARAYGGQGGTGGDVEILLKGLLEGDLSILTWQIGFGGRGGNATATAADGVDADATRDAQIGGDAGASAGSGGSAGETTGYEGMTPADPQKGGSGGTGVATAGNGGDGIRSRPNGAAGGNAAASGGAAGSSTNTSGRSGADAIAQGGNGGMGADVCSAFTDRTLNGLISVFSDPASSDPYIFAAGPGAGIGLLFRILSTLGGPGGAGGNGGTLGARPGQGGFGQNVPAPAGVAASGAGGNGGNGGAGTPSGSGGNAGTANPFYPTSDQFRNPIFQPGTGGGSCPTPAPLFAADEATDQTIQINGSAPWVNVTGVLAADGTVTGTGRGTVAGVQNILVEFAGTWDAASQTLSGTYTIDSEKVISSGHPVVYNVTASGG